MSPQTRIMGHKGKGEPVSLPPHVLRLVRKSFREPLDTLEREVLLGWDQAHGKEFLAAIKKMEGGKKEGAP